MYATDEHLAQLLEALKTIRSQYTLFVGPDDAIANAVLKQTDEAIALLEPKEI